jgi:hypothetical protein
VRKAADAKVSEERLCRDVCELDLALQLCSLELVRSVEEELVGGAEAAGTLGGADDDVSRICQQRPPAVAGPEARSAMG